MSTLMKYSIRHETRPEDPRSRKRPVVLALSWKSILPFCNFQVVKALLIDVPVEEIELAIKLTYANSAIASTSTFAKK